MNIVVYVVCEEDRGAGVSVLGVYLNRDTALANCPSNCYIDVSILIKE